MKRRRWDSVEGGGGKEREGRRRINLRSHSDGGEDLLRTHDVHETLSADTVMEMKGVWDGRKRQLPCELKEGFPTFQAPIASNEGLTGSTFLTNSVK